MKENIKNIKKKIQSFYSKNDFFSVEKYIKQNVKNFNNNDEILVQLGLALACQSKLDEAKQYLTKAISLNQGNVDAYYNLAKVYELNKEEKKAVILYKKIIRLDPNYINAFLNLAMVAYEKKKINLAILIIKKGLKLNSNSYELYNNLGQIYHSLFNYEKAEACYRKSLKFKPQDVNILNNLISNLFKTKKYYEAKILIDTTLLINPNEVVTKYHYGYFYQKTHNFIKAIEIYENILSKTKNFGLVYGSLGLCYFEVRRFDDAKRIFRISKDFYEKSGDLISLRDVFLNSSYLELINYKFKSSAKLYEYRWSMEEEVKKKYEYNYWDGSYCSHLVVWSEQGVGDHIFFGGLLDKLIHLAKKITFEVDKRLVNLFDNYFKSKKINNIKVVDLNTNFESFEEEKKFIPLASLPSVILKDSEDWSISTPFLISEKVLTKDFIANSYKPKIGISWKSFNPDEQYRSINFIDLINVIKRFDCEIYNLQFGDIELEYKATKEKKINFIYDISLDYKNNINEVSSIINKMDFVITVQNTIAHLSCALGKKTIVLLPLNGRWQWGDEKDKCKWYPTSKLIRSKYINNWKDVFDKLKLYLQENLKDKC